MSDAELLMMGKPTRWWFGAPEEKQGNFVCESVGSGGFFCLWENGFGRGGWMKGKIEKERSVGGLR